MRRPSGSGPAAQEPGRPSSGAHRTLSRRPSASGEFPAQAIGRRAASAASSASHKATGLRGGAALELTPEEEQAALEALLARVQPAPHGDAFVGREVGPFKVESFLELDRGERRYVATHGDGKQRVLLRLFPLTGSWGDEFKRMADRGERASKVEHPHIEQCVSSGRTKECFFVGTRPPLGPTLRELLATGPLSEKETGQLLEQIGRALQALHARDFVHGHVAPGEIRRVRPDTWVLCGTGLARPRPALGFLSAGGDVLGMPGYIAPETVDSGQQTRASDLYSLGCVAWAALSQTAPFVADDEVQVLLDQLNLHVPEVKGTEKQPAPVGLSVLVKKLTGYTTDVRYRDAGEMLQDLKALVEQNETPRLFPSPDKGAELDSGKARIGSTFALVVIVLLLLNVGALTLLIQTWLEARRIELVDPVDGVSFPLPEAAPSAPPPTPTPPPPR